MGNDNFEPELTVEAIAKMIDIAIWKSETKVLNRVIHAILANNEKIKEQLEEAGVINQE